MRIKGVTLYLGDFLLPSYLHVLFVVIGVTFQVISYDQSFLVSSCSIPRVLGMPRLEFCFGQKLFSKLAWLLATFFTYSLCHSTYHTQICQSSTRFIHAILFGYQLYHYFLLRRHLLLPTRMSERHWIPWPISINGWTPRIFIFVRSKDNSTISFPRSTLKVP